MKKIFVGSVLIIFSGVLALSTLFLVAASSALSGNEEVAAAYATAMSTSSFAGINWKEVYVYDVIRGADGNLDAATAAVSSLDFLIIHYVDNRDYTNWDIPPTNTSGTLSTAAAIKSFFNCTDITSLKTQIDDLQYYYKVTIEYKTLQDVMTEAGFTETQMKDAFALLNETGMKGQWPWPLPPEFHTITSHYGHRTRLKNGILISEFHHGIDIPCPLGTPLYAIGDGRVITTGFGESAGNYVKYSFGDYQITYMHLSSISVKSGDSIIAGQQVGLAGSTGDSSGPHLHLSVTVNGGSFVDPAQFFGIE